MGRYRSSLTGRKTKTGEPLKDTEKLALNVNIAQDQAEETRRCKEEKKTQRRTLFLHIEMSRDVEHFKEGAMWDLTKLFS